jgi:hypothetical protein
MLKKSEIDGGGLHRVSLKQKQSTGGTARLMICQSG